jgi:hypothetical protein
MPLAIRTATAAPRNAGAKGVAIAPSAAQVSENKIAGQLPLSNPIDSRQSNLSTTASKQGLMQWNQILSSCGARSPIFEKITHFKLFPRHANPIPPNAEQPVPNAVESRHPWSAKRGIPPTPVARQHQHQPAQVSENKIAGQLPLQNQMNTRQSSLSTTASKPGLRQLNQIPGCHRGSLQKTTLFVQICAATRYPLSTASPTMGAEDSSG